MPSDSGSESDAYERREQGSGHAAPTLYLGISGVLHPSETAYRLVHGGSPWLDGHQEYEGVGALEDELRRWPTVRVVLTSTQPHIHGLATVLKRLGPLLAARVVGHTFDDITRHVTREVRTRRGGIRHIKVFAEDYWRMSKAQIVAAHVAWRAPVQWVAVDDEDIGWAAAVRANQLVLTDGCDGLLGSDARAALQTALGANFGTV